MANTKRYIVRGEIVIPVSFPTYAESLESAILRVVNLLNSETVLKIEGEIHTRNGKEHVLIATEPIFNWSDVNE